MNQKDIFTSKNIKTIAVIAILVAVLNLGLNFLQTPKYKSSAKLLVISNQTDTDTYNASQTSNYITGVLGEVIYSTSFIDNVFQTNYSLKNDFGTDLERRQKKWQDMVHVQLDEHKGIIKIDVLHPERQQADQFAKAILDTLLTKHEAYHGAQGAVSLKVIDNPITSQKWAEPNIFQNALLGTLVGLVLGLTFVVLFPNQKFLQRILRFRYIALQHEIDLIKSFQHHQDLEFEKNENKMPQDSSSAVSKLGAEDETTPEQYLGW